jgi:hypothetical protein
MGFFLQKMSYPDTSLIPNIIKFKKSYNLLTNSNDVITSSGNQDEKPCNLAQETSKVAAMASSELPTIPAAMMNNGKKDTR